MKLIDIILAIVIILLVLIYGQLWSVIFVIGFFIGGLMASSSRVYVGGKTKSVTYDVDLLTKKVGKKHELSEVKFTGYLKTLLDTNTMPEVSHIEPDAESGSEFTRTLDLGKTSKYYERVGVFKPSLHWGQLKLFLSEVEFLTKVIDDAGDRDIVFVYAGAAPGDHIEYLHGLFKNIQFELYDPNKFVVRDSDMIKTHVQFFTDKDAQFWKDNIGNRYLAFCSDIRSEPATPKNVAENMKMQLEWWKIMNPHLSMFKFRLPWIPGKTEWPAGEIYIQAYPGPTSTETRLIVKKNAEVIYYDNQQYEDACFYHNTHNRTYKYPNEFHDIGLDDCYDCQSFIQIMKQYIDVVDSTRNLKDLVDEIQNKIVAGRNIYINTAASLMTFMDKAYRQQFKPCGNKKCAICMSGFVEKKYVGSVATEENYKKYLESRA